MYRTIEFQLTHPWGCDLIEIMLLPKTEFQLTHPWGCDVVGGYLDEELKISTHTPVRVWRSAFDEIGRIINFNSHTREGVTLEKSRIMMMQILFQLTHPWGCDHDKGYVSVNDPFQLTHPWGCDNLLTELLTNLVFQLTHPWGCDCDDKPCRKENVISTHTPVRVWLFLWRYQTQNGCISTHTPVRVWLYPIN